MRERSFFKALYEDTVAHHSIAIVISVNFRNIDFVLQSLIYMTLCTFSYFQMRPSLLQSDGCIDRLI